LGQEEEEEEVVDDDELDRMSTSVSGGSGSENEVRLGVFRPALVFVASASFLILKMKKCKMFLIDVKE